RTDAHGTDPAAPGRATPEPRDQLAILEYVVNVAGTGHDQCVDRGSVERAHRLRAEFEAVGSQNGPTTNGHDTTVVGELGTEMVRMGRRQSKRLERTGKIQEGNAFIRRDRDANRPGQGHRLAPWQNLADRRLQIGSQATGISEVSRAVRCAGS